MADTTELAQSHELLIANGNETANLLRHLADNEIDSDYFAVVSECESYGKETDAELSITEFALRAAGYVDALVEALEKAQRANAAQDDHINQQQDRIDWLEKGSRHAAKRINSWRRLAKQSIAEQEKCVDELDAARQRIVDLDRKNSELNSLTQRWAVERAENAERIAELEESHAQVIQSRDHYKRMSEEGLKLLAESRTVTVKLPDLRQSVSGERYVWSDGVFNYSQDVKAALTAAGIKVEAE